LARRGGPVDHERGRLRHELGAAPTLAGLVRCLVVPYAALVHQQGGRSYLRIVAQLRGQFAAWRIESDATTTKHLAAILDELEMAADHPPAIAAERIVALIMLLTGTVAERARRIDDGSANELDHEAFVANLIAMCAAMISA